MQLSRLFIIEHRFGIPLRARGSQHHLKWNCIDVFLNERSSNDHRTIFLLYGFLYETSSFKFLQADGKDFRRDSGDRLEKLIEPIHLKASHVTNDQQSPFFPEALRGRLRFGQSANLIFRNCIFRSLWVLLDSLSVTNSCKLSFYSLFILLIDLPFLQNER